ncbi:MAG TPA: MurR/RpiR family transcriptional regulator [Candidatus Scatomonas pullistercoris]|uniref:MurR/RpiR family transcriptional regulator n=1 Tax=Candidatus Scatomonas pullistercoris TaxID=2840920 RepID=A0A9D1P5A2_9FIRM|nr:MurR/RpiR family transcriptional regulator [Candidatus Scatomonas pullistercoris]
MDALMRRKIESVYGRLRPSEKKTADYLLEYRGRAGDLLLEELAREAGVSQPTILRFVKALGYRGFREFKYALVQEEGREQREEGEIELYGFRLSSRDKLEEIPGKIVGTSIRMLEETLKSIRAKDYEQAVEAILRARSIVIYSVENSVCTASDLMTKLLYLGLDCRMYGDYYLQNVSATNLGKEDLAIGISYSGCSRHTVEMMALARKAGAGTLVLTNFENSLIARYADILLCASNRQFLCGDTIFSRISQMALVDMLYAGVLNRDYGRLSKKLNKTSALVARRAYREGDEIL